MMRAIPACGTLLILFACLSCRAEGFAFGVDAPKFRVSIPGIPQVKMEVHPKHASQPHFRFQGLADPYTIAIFTPVAAAGMTPLECAGATVRALSARSGVPPAAEILKSRLDANTYIAMYATRVTGSVVLHAHLLSAAGGTHCIEVYATKTSMDEDDLADWVTDLEKASIDPG